jgi:hypothetical protein
MWVRYLSGNLAGCAGELSPLEAEAAIATGYAEAATEPPSADPVVDEPAPSDPPADPPADPPSE